jgi:hypothetical protein
MEAIMSDHQSHHDDIEISPEEFVEMLDAELRRQCPELYPAPDQSEPAK